MSCASRVTERRNTILIIYTWLAVHRWKKPVGDRLGIAAFNTVYGGTKAYTGPTLSGCAYAGGKLTIEFNTSLLRGDTLQIGKFPGLLPPPDTDKHGDGGAAATRLGSSSGKDEMASAGSQLYLQTDAKIFCLERRPALNSTGGKMGFDYCPKWAGGDGSMTPPPPPNPAAPPPPPLDSNWILVNYTKACPAPKKTLTRLALCRAATP